MNQTQEIFKKAVACEFLLTYVVQVLFRSIKLVAAHMLYAADKAMFLTDDKVQFFDSLLHPCDLHSPLFPPVGYAFRA